MQGSRVVPKKLPAMVFAVAAVVLAACGGGAPPPVAPAGPDLATRAASGEVEAQYLLGVEICCGSGNARGRRDTAESTAWLCRAARQGEPRAQYRLGVIYAAGLDESGIGSKIFGAGSSRSKPRLAAMWFDLAMAAGHGEAASRRLALGRRLSAEDHLAVEKMRARWREAPCDWQAVYGAAAAR